MPLNHVDLLNHLARQIGAQTYLEIGVRNRADCFDRIEVRTRQGVDPRCRPGGGGGWLMWRAYSFEYWPQCHERFDLIFIDGDHSYDAVCLDIRQALYRLRVGGRIVCHDVYPDGDERCHGRPDGRHGDSGGAWRAFAGWCHTGGTACLWPHDHGCGILSTMACRNEDADVESLDGWLRNWRNYCQEYVL